MDIDEYRKNYEAALSKTRAGRSRKAAGAAPSKSAGTRDLTTIINDRSNDASTRVATIGRVSEGAVAKPSVMTLLLKVLDDPSEDDDVRKAALAAIQQNSFSATEFRRYVADFHQALRSAATDDDPELRERAMDILALGNDEYVQRLLVEGLQDPKTALVKPQRALQMIGYDVHAEHYGMLRDIVENSTKPNLRRTALRLLAADSDAKPLFARIAADKSEDSAARAASGIALQSLAPDDFASLARDVVLDDDDDDAVRATFINALAQGSAASDAELDDKVRAINDSPAPSKQLKGAARQFLRVHRGPR